VNDDHRVAPQRSEEHIDPEVIVAWLDEPQDLAPEERSRIEQHLGRRGRQWTHRAALPGGDFPTDGYGSLVASLQAAYPFLEAGHVRRLARLYGTRARRILEGAASAADLGAHFGADLYAAEVRYLMKEEWAVTAADVLWRRTKRGLRLTAEQAAALDAYMHEAGSGAGTQAA